MRSRRQPEQTAASGPALPWFKEYPRDRRNDPRRWALTLEQRGALDELRAAAWLGGGRIPGDDATLAVLSTAGRRWAKIGPPIVAAFFVRDGSELVCLELAKQHAEASHYVFQQQLKAARAVEARRKAASAGDPVGASAGDPVGASADQPPSDVSRSDVTEQALKQTGGHGVPSALIRRRACA